MKTSCLPCALLLSQSPDLCGVVNPKTLRIFRRRPNPRHPANRLGPPPLFAVFFFLFASSTTPALSHRRVGTSMPPAIPKQVVRDRIRQLELRCTRLKVKIRELKVEPARRNLQQQSSENVDLRRQLHAAISTLSRYKRHDQYREKARKAAAAKRRVRRADRGKPVAQRVLPDCRIFRDFAKEVTRVLRAEGATSSDLHLIK